MSSTSAQATVAVPRNNFIGLIEDHAASPVGEECHRLCGAGFDGKLFDPELFLKTTGIFLAFCLLSSSVSILNDLVDMERKIGSFPRKRARPLASGS